MIPQINFRTRDLLSNIVGNLFYETKATLKETLKEGTIAAEKVFYGAIGYLAEPSRIRKDLYSVFDRLEVYVKTNGMG